MCPGNPLEYAATLKPFEKSGQGAERAPEFELGADFSRLALVTIIEPEVDTQFHRKLRASLRNALTTF
jgi:hypothetical protein